jgi:cytochrome subunit of sulfide dehydrogenase
MRINLTSKLWRPGFAGWLLAALLALSAAGAAMAQQRDPQALQVQLWASSCMACHGPEGRAEGTGLMLAGLSADDLKAKLLGYKTGKLKGTVMHQHSKGYSDEELSRIAQYFAAVK